MVNGAFRLVHVDLGRGKWCPLRVYLAQYAVYVSQSRRSPERLQLPHARLYLPNEQLRHEAVRLANIAMRVVNGAVR